MHRPTSVGRWTRAPMGAMDTRTDGTDGLSPMGVTLTIAPHRWPMGVAQISIYRWYVPSMGLRGPPDGQWECAARLPSAQRWVRSTTRWVWARCKFDELARAPRATGRGVGQLQRLAHTRRPPACARPGGGRGRQLQRWGSGSGSGARLAHVRCPIFGCGLPTRLRTPWPAVAAVARYGQR
jgi:hypothetical protein